MDCIYFATVFYEFVLIRSDTKYLFLSNPRDCDWGLIVAIVYYFLIWNKKKEHNIIICRVIRSHLGPTYIWTLLYTLPVNLNGYVQFLIITLDTIVRWE